MLRNARPLKNTSMNQNNSIKCLNCNEGYSYERILRILQSTCVHCDSPVKIAIGLAGVYYGPDAFTKNEIKLAKKNGVFLKTRYARNREESWLVSTCDQCNTYIKDVDIIDYLIATRQEELRFQDIETGIFYCGYCSHDDTSSKGDIFEDLVF